MADLHIFKPRNLNSTQQQLPLSLSSLRDLTATSSAYNPPSPLPSSSDSHSSSSSSSSEVTDRLDSLTLSSSPSQPIPIPKPPTAAARDPLPVTPLTGRFEKGCYFASQLDQPPFREEESKSSKNPLIRRRRRRRCRDRQQSSRQHHRNHNHHHHHRLSRMRPDSSNFYSPVASSTMSASSPSSQSSQPRSQNTKSVPSFHLGNLPRFHPAFYQPATSGAQPAAYRQSSGDSSGTGSSRMTGQPSPSPSAPRLDPLRSPGPVTPLVLEDEGGYLASGSTKNAGNLSSRDPGDSNTMSDTIDRLIAREAEQSRQRTSKTNAKGR